MILFFEHFMLVRMRRVMEIKAYSDIYQRKATKPMTPFGKMEYEQAAGHEHHSGTEMRIPSSPVEMHFLALDQYLNKQGWSVLSKISRDTAGRNNLGVSVKQVLRQTSGRAWPRFLPPITACRPRTCKDFNALRARTRKGSSTIKPKSSTREVRDNLFVTPGTDFLQHRSIFNSRENLQTMQVLGGRQNSSTEVADVLPGCSISVMRGGTSHTRERPSTYGSAGRRMRTTPDTSNNYEDATPPEHPFLRMYRTRPGAFASLLSREADLRQCKVMPGSTFASLMEPHRSVLTNKSISREETEAFECCIKGATIVASKEKRKTKASPYGCVLPFPISEHFVAGVDMAVQWRGHFKQLKQRNHNRKMTSATVNNSQTSSDKDDGLKVPTAALHTLSIHPKQFVLSSHQDDVAMDLERSSSNESSILTSDEAMPERELEEMKRVWEELQGFSDLDYVLPHHLDQLLRQEGVDDVVVDKTVAMGQLRHDRANYLNRLYHIKRRKYLSRPSRFSNSLPPIHITQPRRSKSQEQEPERVTLEMTVEDRRERRKSRQRPWTESSASGHTRITNLPKISPSSKEEQNKLFDCQAKDELSLLKFEVDKVRWEAERQEEMLSYPTEFIQPRLVLISSKVPRCRSMSKAVRKGDTNILYIIYDFETGSLQDLLDSVQSNLENCRPGCKAKSVCLICQGSHGCLYLLRGLVLTPQKLRRPAYNKVREFLKDLAFFISKVSEARETTLHLLGGQLENEQGRQLIEEMQMAMLPNFINITAIDERSRAGRENIEQYFDFRKFLLWRTKVDSRPGLVDLSDVTRSWSSLAEAAEDGFKDTGQG